MRVEVPGTVQVRMRVAYRLRGRDGRQGVDATVSEEVPFVLPVADARDRPVAVRVERRACRADWDDMGALSLTGEDERPPWHAVDLRSDGDGLLRPLMAPGGAHAVGAEWLHAAEAAARKRDLAPVGRHHQPLSWPHHPSVTRAFPRPWAARDRSEVAVTRVTEDGREPALAAAALAMAGACVIDGAVWVRSGPPVLVTCDQVGDDVFRTDVAIPACDQACDRDASGAPVPPPTSEWERILARSGMTADARDRY